MGFRVGKRAIELPGETKKRMPGTELDDAAVKSLGQSVKRMLERGEILSDTVRPGDMDMPPAQGSTIVDERIARERLDDKGIAIDLAADRALVFAVYDHVVVGRPAKDTAAAHKVDVDAVTKLAKRHGGKSAA